MGKLQRVRDWYRVVSGFLRRVNTTSCVLAEPKRMREARHQALRWAMAGY